MKDIVIIITEVVASAALLLAMILWAMMLVPNVMIDLDERHYAANPRTLVATCEAKVLHSSPESDQSPASRYATYCDADS